MHNTIDHLVVAARTLAEGIDYVRRRLGVTPQPGGAHLRMGTHNALLGLGSGCYLEVIAIDPDAARPDRPRWFGLDEPAVQQALAVRPRLLHWVARSTDLDAALRIDGLDGGVALDMQRGRYHWRIAVPADGHLPGGGVLPTLIEWRGDHPASALGESACRLERLDASHPQSGALGGRLTALGLDHALNLAPGERAALHATLSTPDGPATLD